MAMTYTLWNKECLGAMRDIPDGSIDMVMCDLPYGTTACKWDTIIPFEPLWAAYRRVCKKNAAIVLTASQPFTSALVMSNVKEFRYQWTWDKMVTPTGHLNAKKMALRRTEDVLVFYHSQCTYNPQMTTGKAVSKTATTAQRKCVYGAHADTGCKDVTTRYPVNLLQIKKVDTRHGRLHPTQKPVALMEYLIKTYSNEGDTVLDNCMGSGTTGVACGNLNRRFIGIEKDTEHGYFQIAQQRISAAYNWL